MFYNVFFLSACQNPDIRNEQPDTSEVLHESNYVIPYQLTHAEEELLRLVCRGDRINIFNFSVSDDIKSVSFWCEEYENGQPTYTHLQTKSEVSGEGRISINIDNKELHMAVKSESDSGRGSGAPYTPSGNSTRHIKYLRQQTEIKPDSEIALLVYAIQRTDNDENEALQMPGFYIKNSDRLSDFDKVYLFKCKFSEEVVD